MYICNVEALPTEKFIDKQSNRETLNSSSALFGVFSFKNNIMKFLQLTNLNGKPFFINFKKVSEFFLKYDGTCTVIVFDENYTESVKEKPETIMMMLKNEAL